MKASELVKRLQELIEEHGDCDVWNEYQEVNEADHYEDDDYRFISFK